ncbi:MAG: enoyl-CoA hydratase/isomerase family protein, partial [Chloroflexota bacterium]|nr:enoyl-CoA hydratase/isomerase family protein [Chloroflexota bacterium]
MPEERVVTVEKQAPIGYIVLNRPPANSYDKGFMEDLDAAIEEIRNDESIKVVITRSALDRFFSAGADIKAFASGTPESNARLVAYAHEVLFKIGRTPKIFIASIGGHALGGGLEIALAHDLRFGSTGEYKLG